MFTPQPSLRYHHRLKSLSLIEKVLRQLLWHHWKLVILSYSLSLRSWQTESYNKLPRRVVLCHLFRLMTCSHLPFFRLHAKHLPQFSPATYALLQWIFPTSNTNQSTCNVYSATMQPSIRYKIMYGRFVDSGVVRDGMLMLRSLIIMQITFKKVLWLFFHQPLFMLASDFSWGTTIPVQLTKPVKGFPCSNFPPVLCYDCPGWHCVLSYKLQIPYESCHIGISEERICKYSTFLATDNERNLVMKALNINLICSWCDAITCDFTFISFRLCFHYDVASTSISSIWWSKSTSSYWALSPANTPILWQ